MKLTALALHDFRSYADAEIAFSGGQNYIFGKNWQGKSSIMDGIGYALFGRRILPARLAGAAVRTDHLVRRGAGGGSVELSFEHRGEEYCLRRTCPRDMPTLSMDGCRIAQGSAATGEYLCEMLGIDAPLFANIFYSPQDELRRVLELDPESRKVFIETVLGFDYLKDVRTSAKRSAEALQRWKDGYAGADAAAVRERSRAIEARIDAIEEQIRHLDAAIAEPMPPPPPEPSGAAHARPLEERGALRERIRQCRSLMEGLSSGTCPSCLQPLPAGAKKPLLQRIGGELSRIEAAIATNEQQIRSLAAAAAEAERVRRDGDVRRLELVRVRAERDAMEREAAVRRAELDAVRRETAACGDRMERKVQEECAFLAEIQQAIDEFRGNVRSLVARDLENAANFFMRKFGDGDFDAELRITEEFGFETLLHGEQVPLSNLSGAARDILAFSLRYGLYRIAAKEIDFLLLDEPTRHFDRANTFKLKEAFNELADHQLIVITVNDEFHDAVGKKFRVEKDADRCSIVREL
ncbi:MAG: AAA family ATPase [Methanomicrobiales archaeon]|nr:AAA family ATPase [Methanomicrobiales archaeon]MDI6875864.1 AAA family ATPase [Methanomicrobiales archaeon]